MSEKRETGFRISGKASEAGKKGGAVVMGERGREHFVAMGKKGGQALKAGHDPDYFKELGRRGGQKRWGRQDERGED